MRARTTCVVLAVSLLTLPSTMASSDAPSDENRLGFVDVSALQAFLRGQPAETTNLTERIDIERWLARLLPWDELCGRIVEGPWIMGVSDVVRPIPDGSGYWINVPLAAYGGVAYAADGNPVVDAHQEDPQFTGSDVAAYLAAAGIYYDTHQGIGTTSYIQITARPLEDPILC